MIRATSRNGQAGFTLVELMAALLAGVLVAMGIVALSKESTRTFHEEVRSASSEANLRGAVDRLRADLERAGYMSTGNIRQDPFIAHDAAVAYPWGITLAGITGLQGIYLSQGGSSANAPLSTVQSPALTPDVIQIGGNFTVAEQFEVAMIETASGPPAPAGCTRIWLSPSSPSLYRVIGTDAPTAIRELAGAFQPVPEGTSDTSQFIVRLVDDGGCSQYLATCAVARTAASGGAAGYTGAIPCASGSKCAYVDVYTAPTTGTPLVYSAQTGGKCGISGLGSGRLAVNPVQIVRWELMNPSTANYPAQFKTGLDQTASNTLDSNKYDLVRSYVTAAGATDPQTSEVVAEYAVNLSFGITVDSNVTTEGATSNYSCTGPTLTSWGFDETTNTPLWTYPVNLQPASSTGPHRIRSVRARLATRSQLADRTTNVAGPGGQFLYRYCMTSGGCTGSSNLQWARVRTVTLEAALQNQAQDCY